MVIHVIPLSDSYPSAPLVIHVGLACIIEAPTADVVVDVPSLDIDLSKLPSPLPPVIDSHSAYVVIQPPMIEWNYMRRHRFM